MKILFLIGATSRIRNFDETILDLADRGHTITLAGRLRKGGFEIGKSIKHKRLSGRVNPTTRSDGWRDFVDLLRGARDYMRYLDPRYADATRLVRRAFEIAPTEFALFCERHPWVKRHWKVGASALALCEDLIPSDPGFEAFVREEKPDLMVVTPLVTFESYQTDYVKAAHALGIPVAFIPFSWDNLTNKGLMRVHPDRVLVWNEIQRKEAVELHGSDPESVIVTGAARFDSFFARSVSTPRAEFFARFGLDPDRPLVVFLGSSQLTGPNELELVRHWAESLRASSDPALRDCAILVRPHPAVLSSWVSVDLSDLHQVAISLQSRQDDGQELFDSMWHAHVAVGLNTSAMLEAAVVGRPVHTLVLPGFDEGQVGTMHFHYLVEAFGGLATVARNLEDHHRQLSEVLTGKVATSPKSRLFAEKFLRPHGIDRPVSPILADEIERTGQLRKRPQVANPLQAPLRRGLYAWLRRRGRSQRAAVDSTIIGTSLSLRPVKTALEEIQNGTSMVFIGPWVDPIGLELLYWVPFVRWASATYGLRPERLAILSLRGLPRWYDDVAQRFLEVASLFSATELAEWQRRTVAQSEQDPKQSVLSPFDAEVVERAARAFDVSEPQVLHPLLMFRTLRRIHADNAHDRLSEILRYEPRHTRRGAGREPFVAVSGESSDWLPDTDENRSFLATLLADAANAGAVVNIDGLPLTEREDTLARADAFLGAYGDNAILAASCGTSATVYHSARLPPDQPEHLEAASRAAGWGTVTALSVRRYKGFPLAHTIRA
jgi:hypothetical protein